MITDWPNATAHIDADYFYANCELARNPKLRGKPVMVLGKLGSCILAKTPEAKRLGIGTAMPLWDAKKICPPERTGSVPVRTGTGGRAGPKGIYLQGDFRYYTIVSRYLMDLLTEWSPIVEVYSVDEAFMDLNGLRGMYRMPYDRIADRIREEVKNRIGITVSVGISVNKTLAKMACELHKPDGTTVIAGKDIDNFLSEIPVEEIPGIGMSRSELLDKYGIHTALQLARTPQSVIQQLFGKTGLLLWRELRGEISFPVQKEPPPPKSIARTSSFDKPLTDVRVVQGMAVFHMERAIEALYRHHLLTGEMVLYLRDKAFRMYGLNHRFEKPTNDFYELVDILSDLAKNIPRNQIWRSTGVILSRLSPASGRQLNLFESPDKLVKSENVNHAKLKLNERFGRTTVRSGTTLFISQKDKSESGRLDFPLF